MSYYELTLPDDFEINIPLVIDLEIIADEGVKVLSVGNIYYEEIGGRHLITGPLADWIRECLSVDDMEKRIEENLIDSRGDTW